MQEPRKRLSKLLETHFCDAVDDDKHGSELKALSDEKRLKILTLLTFREMCVCELTAALGLTQPNLSHHVKKLEYAGLVRHEKRGKWVYYFLTDAGKPERLGLA